MADVILVGVIVAIIVTVVRNLGLYESSEKKIYQSMMELILPNERIMIDVNIFRNR